jgi:hypothetical protein
LLTRVGIDYSLHPKYLHLLTPVLHVWPFVLFEKIVKVLFNLLWHVLS